MKLEDLPEEMQEEIVALKHGSKTIEVDITDALDDAKNLSEFKEIVSNRMKDLIGEALDAMANFCNDPENPDTVLNMIELILIHAGYKNMGYAQTMPGINGNEVIQRFLKDRKELIEIISNDEPDKDILEGLLDNEEDEEVEGA
jgi:hypothetical protein